jgi:hypothetical protein
VGPSKTMWMDGWMDGWHVQPLWAHVYCRPELHCSLWTGGRLRYLVVTDESCKDAVPGQDDDDERDEDKDLVGTTPGR